MLDWTTDTPTEPGYYWRRIPELKVEPMIVRVGNFPGYPMMVSYMGTEKEVELRHLKGEWLGPISPPKQ